MLRSTIALPALAMLAALALPGLCACNGRAKLPADPGLAGDDLGIGVSLGQPVAAAQQAASGAGALLWVMTREELNQRDPRVDRPDDQDLVVALYSTVEEGSGATGPLGAENIDELRCYLADPATSALTLLRHKVAQMSAASAIAVFGEPLAPAAREDSADGNTHLTYYFTYAPALGPDAASPVSAPPEHTSLALKLMLSIGPTGTCYAFSLMVTDMPVK